MQEQFCELHITKNEAIKHCLGYGKATGQYTSCAYGNCCGHTTKSGKYKIICGTHAYQTLSISRYAGHIITQIEGAKC